MSISSPGAASAPGLPALEPTLLAAGLAAAVVVRVLVAGPAGPASLRAGVVFAAMLGLLAAAAGTRARVDRRGLLVGAAGAALLVVPVVLRHLVDGSVPVHPASGYLPWALGTAGVASAEEALLRGALFDALGRYGDAVAVIGAAVAFAGLHLPLYGWHAMPLDLAVGLLLGALRLTTGGWLAPAVAHTGADLAGWWLL